MMLAINQERQQKGFGFVQPRQGDRRAYFGVTVLVQLQSQPRIEE
jgi:cold shock CspA family protein